MAWTSCLTSDFREFNTLINILTKIFHVNYENPLVKLNPGFMIHTFPRKRCRMKYVIPGMYQSHHNRKTY